MQEFQSICRDSQRKKRLDSAIRGESKDGLEMELVGETDLVQLADVTLKQIQQEFNEYFEERQQAMINVVQECEEQILDRRLSQQELESEWERRASFHKEVQSPTYRRRHSSRNFVKRFENVEVQTDPTLPCEDDVPNEGKSPAKFRGSICVADMSRGKKPSVLLQAEMGLRSTTRSSICLGTPLRRPSLMPSMTATSIPSMTSVDEDTPQPQIIKYSSAPIEFSRQVSEDSETNAQDGEIGKNQSESEDAAHDQPAANSLPQSEDIVHDQPIASALVDGLSAGQTGNTAVTFQSESISVPLPPVVPSAKPKASGKNIRDSTMSSQFEGFRATTPSTRASSRVESRNESRSSPFSRTGSPEAPLSIKQPLKPSHRKTSARTILQFERTA